MFDIKTAIQQATMEGEDDDEGDDDDAPLDLTDAIEESIVDLGYDSDDDARDELARLLAAADEGTAPFPENIRSRVAGQSGAAAADVDAALKRVIKPMLTAVTASIAYRKERREQIDELEDGEKQDAIDDDARIMDRLRTMGPCPQGFSWFRQGNGWRCAGGSHFVYDDDPILSMENVDDD